jgi:metallo-beta-lactamase class B
MLRWFLSLPMFLAVLGFAAGSGAQQTLSQRAEWNVPIAPFHVVGNIQYVGAAGVSAFLITTPKGSILLDGGLPETAPLIERSIAQLGFRVSDVKVLLNSHAHFDHAGGLAELKRKTKASLAVSRGDARSIEAGSATQPAVKVDRRLKDGDTVELGGTVLTAHVTPGHTPGCTTWTMNTEEGGKTLRVVFYCSTSVVDRLLGNHDYPGIVTDYERSFPVLRALPCDVFLGPHPSFFGMQDKLLRRAAGSPNPFIDPEELARYVAASEQQFRRALAAEQAAK